MHPRVVVLLLLIIASSVSARDFRRLEAASDATQFQPDRPETTDVAELQIISLNDGIRLFWEESPRHSNGSGPRFTGYQVLAGESPVDLQPCAFVTTPAYSFPRETSFRFFSIKAIYAGTDSRLRKPGRLDRDASTLLDFEADEYDLQSYSQQQDAQFNRWEVSDEEAYPPSNRSLKLYGNTWKRLAFERTEVEDSTVWTIAVMSSGGNTVAELQAFGVGDGAEELIYTFAGKETVWEHSWNISNQDIRTRGRWQVWRLAIGYDWNIRYGYYPSIDELIFINDNDTTNPAAVVYFDELIDITGDIPPQPKPKARWSVDLTSDGSGTGVRFLATVNNREPNDVALRWDFGDGFSGSGYNPLHFYRQDGVYRVGLEARAAEGSVGRTNLVVEVGSVRTQKSVICAFVGDVMLARRYEDVGGLIREEGPEAVFERIRDRTRTADIFQANLECPLTDEGTQHPTKEFAFRGRPENVAGLVSAGADVVSLANNHSGDYSRRGLEETGQVLDAAGILRHGAGLNEYEALQPVFKTVNGIRIGFLGYCNRTGRDYNARPFLDAGFDREGYAYFSADNIIRSVPEAAAQCDLLAVIVHGGQEYELAPLAIPQNSAYPPWSEEVITYSARLDSATRELEHMAIDLGAGIVIGHHPHILQGYEVYNGVVIAHSLGNFAFDQNFWETWPSVIVWAEINQDGVQRVELEPIFVDRYQPTPAIGNLGSRILDRLAGYSTPLNATVVPNYEQMRATVAINPETVNREYVDHEVTLATRYIPSLDVWRTEPFEFAGEGFPTAITGLEPNGFDSDWEVRLGRDILLVGNMESEGASVWNYNSGYEGRDSTDVYGGRYSSFLRRNAGMGDAVTDMIQRIPIIRNEELTLVGHLRITNGRNARIAVRWYRYRYDNLPENILGDSTGGASLTGDLDWQKVWGEVKAPDGADFGNVRWQLYAPQNGSGTLWADDVKLVRWDGWNDFEASLPVDSPSDLCYLQIQTRRPLEQITVRYRTVILTAP